LIASPRQDQTSAGAFARDRQIAHLSFNFVLDITAHGIAGLKPLESLLVMAINQANIAPLTRDPEARRRYGSLERPAPDEERRPVSVRALAASMQLPYETARRNVRNLEARKVCIASEAGVLVPAAFLASEAYLDTANKGHEGLRTLFLMLNSRELLDPLPPPNYAETEPPVRGAVRLMSDYLLRTAESLVGRIGDLTAGLVILPLVAAAAGAEAEDETAPMSVSAIARRTRLPAETVRRKAAALVEAGHCRSGSGGLTVAGPSLIAPGLRGLLRGNAIAVQRMYAGLAERGVVAAWAQAPAACRA
jgi:hypothetical protein